MFSAPSRRPSISHVGHTRQTAEMEKRFGEYSEISVRDVTRKISVRRNIGSTIYATRKPYRNSSIFEQIMLFFSERQYYAERTEVDT